MVRSRVLSWSARSAIGLMSLTGPILSFAATEPEPIGFQFAVTVAADLTKWNATPGLCSRRRWNKSRAAFSFPNCALVLSRPAKILMLSPPAPSMWHSLHLPSPS